MKKIYLISVIIFTTLILSGCFSKASATNAMPRDFAISFSYGMNEYQMNVLDTYKGIIQKDLIDNGVSSIDYKIKKDDLKMIYSKLCELKIKEIRNDMTSNSTSGNNFYVSPCLYYKIIFTIDKKQYTVTGDSNASNCRNIQAGNFCKFVVFMKQFVESTKVYKSFPQAEGGYD